MNTDNYVRIKTLASYPQRPEKTHTYKSGENIGKQRKINAQPASQGLLHVSEKTIWEWVRKGQFPQPIKLSGNVTVWRMSEVQAWIESKMEAQA